MSPGPAAQLTDRQLNLPDSNVGRVEFFERRATGQKVPERSVRCGIGCYEQTFG
jgi:hypothetical protein